MTRRLGRAGFSLVELLVALAVGTMLLGALTGLFVRQMEFYRQDDALREARSGARASLNVLLSDLRMVERLGGVVDADSREVTVRVPYLWGTVCTSAAGATEVAFFPADSVVVAEAGLSGWATRSAGTGAWTYREGGVTVAPSDGSACAGAAVTVLDGGSTRRITPGAGALPPGTPVFLYQQIEYRFGASTTVAGRDGLFRRVVATDVEEELVAPFSATARFRFFAGGWEAQDAPPANLTTIRGLEIHLDAESLGPGPGTGAPLQHALVASVFFMNAEG